MKNSLLTTAYYLAYFPIVGSMLNSSICFGILHSILLDGDSKPDLPVLVADLEDSSLKADDLQKVASEGFIQIHSSNKVSLTRKFFSTYSLQKAASA